MPEKFLFAGLDCESSARFASEGSQLIQAGVALPTSNGIASMKVNVLLAADSGWTDEAENVHGISREVLQDTGVEPAVADAMLVKFLHDNNVTAPGSAVAVGFNTASFDFPLFADTLPETLKLFSYRTFELNAVCMYIQDVTGVSWLKVKSDAKEFAAKQIAAYHLYVEAGPHDAQYDAVEALYIQEFLTQVPLLVSGS